MSESPLYEFCKKGTPLAKMEISFPLKFTVRFPGDLEYIPAIRKFVSEFLQVCNYSPKFAYRSEIIIDEICNNAVNFGCVSNDALVELVCEVDNDRIEIMVKDQGGSKENLTRLQQTMQKPTNESDLSKGGLGLEIVRLLSEKVDLSIESDNLTSIHITRKREDAQ